ncbi:NAD(P)/FAD-dependent oxidoreductase [Eoetvoesiella caeni]|uniref:3-phenylpropionate/trans-cinnamate dioxygenase ferredoxin reductase subunit n=2 Tax=Eoetvoesiella caeni TaxID=645616 RepID=A0A366H139_9BURK|nr:FAD-dependent oxidoreductase [Eoetvoesiella caeni]MCI2811241.1 FAD-dependent oxidoreductase [Eoetvoesiella caeni]NYT57150.1 FAD-dependent oxidoreductase [Eoetvoesiella caeni]RBP33662.1 3-phenylpropionate/trans-cinnamate dioxygenase ferredoxin reductase subunit [Eoetvoesiella caeni]
MNRGVVVLGGGQAACQLVASLRQMKYDGTLTMIGDEHALPYQRPPLSKGFLKGEADIASISLRTAEFYQKIGCEMRMGVRAVSINRESQIVELENGDSLGYECLVLATGARPKTYPGLPIETKNLHYLRTLAHAGQLSESLSKAKKLAIIGAGYVGMEVAASARQLGVEVSIFETAPRVMLRSVGPQLASIIQDIHTRHGVRLNLSAEIKEIKHDALKGSFTIVTGTHGTDDFDLLVIGIGAQANTELAVGAGIGCGYGILVDASCRTSDPAVFAIGDCSEQNHPIYGPGFRLESVQNAVDQAKCAAAAIVGGPQPPPSVPWFWSDQYGHRVQVAGLPRHHDVCVIREQTANEGALTNAGSVWYLKDRKVVSVETLDAPKDFMVGRSYIKNNTEVDAERLAKEELLA